jgi:hypothetical protein
VSAFLWLGVLAVQLFYFFMHWLLCLAKKINVLHCSVGKRQKNALAGGNTAEGLCVLAYVGGSSLSRSCGWACSALLFADVYIQLLGFSPEAKNSNQ